MKKIWTIIGRLAFWISWPALWIYLRRGKRTRLLLVCGNEFLVLSSWLSTGDWGLPGGGVHKNEESIDGVIREVYEETSIKLNKQQIKHLYEGKSGRKGLCFGFDCYVAKLPKKPAVNVQRGEILGYAWQSLDAPNLPLAEDAADILAHWRKNS